MTPESLRSPATSQSLSTPGRRALVFGLSLLLPLAQLVPIAHLALTPHVVCSEHGELSHEDGCEAVHAPDHSHEGPRNLEPGAPRHEHEHCAVLVVARDHQTCHGGSTSVEVVAPPFDEGEPSATTVFVFPGRLLLLAPKQSPPSLA